MGTLVSTAGSWVWLCAGLCTVIGGVFVAGRWIKAQLAAQDARAKSQFTASVTEVVVPLLEPIREDLGHVHDCLERIGADAISNAQAAVTAANDAKAAAAAAAVAADDARSAVTAHAAAMEEHIAADA